MTSVPAEDFERRYRADPDPWRFASSAYEQRRYDVTLACLPAGRFHRAFEPGCSTGELTRRLVTRCDEVVAWDASPTVVGEARARSGEASTAEFAVGAIPHEWPGGTFDLIVLSEIGYYFDRALLELVAQRSTTSLDTGGTLAAVHWLGESADHLLGGDDVHEVLDRRPDLAHSGRFRDEGFRLDWWRKA